MKSFDEIIADKSLIRTAIRQYAHWYDKLKYMEANDQQRESLRTRLLLLLKIFVPKEDCEDIIWAENIAKGICCPEVNKHTKTDSLESVIINRRSCRSWAEEAIDKSIIDKVINAGIMAPSSANRQAVRFFVIKESEEKARIAEICKHPFIKKAPIMIMVGVETVLYEQNEYDRIVEDASVCAQNMALMAESLGLGSCFITASEFKDTSFNKEFSISENIRFFFGIPLGYPLFMAAEIPRMEIENYMIRKNNE